ncbi:MAG TPA: class I SAM-dependent methyltransferase [Solirubrobacteraceae bacterium]
MKTLAITACPVCAAPGARDVDLGEGHVLRECTQCGTVYAPAYADHAEVFTDGYLEGGAGDFGIDVSHPRFQAFMREICTRRLETIEKAIGKGSVLDVGCGSGEFLNIARQRGWEVTGVEPLPDAAQVARDRGFTVHTGTLETVELPERYDLVTAFHVLEHMPEGPPFLKTLAAEAKPGGHVCIESPNWDSIARKVRLANWEHLRPLEHLVHYTPATVRDAFGRAGMTPVLVRTPTYLSSDATLDEATTGIARPSWRGPLKVASPRREVLGHRAHVPSPPVRALLNAVAAAYDRRGVGATVFAIGRV